MFSIIEKSGLIPFVKKEAFPLLFSLLLAEFLFKFGSFVLECSAFLITWYLIGSLMNWLKRLH